MRRSQRFGFWYVTGMALLLGGFLSGCNTIAGAGEDIQAAGEAVEDTAEDVEDEL